MLCVLDIVLICHDVTVFVSFVEREETVGCCSSTLSQFVIDLGSSSRYTSSLILHLWLQQ